MAQYDSIAKKYYENRLDKTRFDFNRDLEVPAMVKMIGNIEGKSVLDVGCGFGDHLKKLSKQNPKKIVGFDISPEMIKFTQSFKIPNSQFYVGNMNNPLNHKNSEFDLVFSSLAIHYISKNNLNKLFLEVNRVLKKGGEFIFSTGHPIFNLRITSIGDIMRKGNYENGMSIRIDYFNENCIYDQRLNLNLYNFTFETLIKTSINNGFEIVDYKDVRPISSAKKYDKYEIVNKIPTFIIFKLRKK